MSASVGEGNALTLWDWGAFAGTLAGVACLGSIAGRTTTTSTVQEDSSDGRRVSQGAKSEYVFGTGGKGGFASIATSIPAMMLSLARGTTGVRAFIAFPAEQYYYGIGMWEIIYGVILSFPIIAFVFLPVFFELNVTSVYQYLELRFRSKAARRLASATYALRSIIMLGVTMLTPSVALSGFSGLPLSACLLIFGILTIAGSVTGGLRGVVIVDALQGILLIVVCIFISSLGCYHAGGFFKAFQINRERGRLDFFNFDTDPTLRVTTVSALIGQLGMSLTGMGCQQNFAQRYKSMPSKKSAIAALMGTIPLTTLIFSMPWMVGIAIFAALADCDPLAAGKTTRIDGVFTYFINEYFTNFPGLTGFVLAIISNSALNILISNLNAIGTVIWEDFVSQIPRFRHFNETSQLYVIRGIAMFSACLIMSLAFSFTLLPGLNEASMITNSATSGALLGMFVLAILFPIANGKGVVAGTLAGHIMTMWVAIGGLFADTSGVKTKIDPLPTFISGCNFTISSMENYSTTSFYNFQGEMDQLNSGYGIVNGTMDSLQSQVAQTNILTSLYAMSFMYYSLFGCIITVAVGLVVSVFTSNPDKDIYEERMLHSAVVHLCKMLPGKPRAFAPHGSTLGGTPPNKNQSELTGIKSEEGVINAALQLDE